VKKAKAQDIVDYTTHNLERRKEMAKGDSGTALYALVSISSILEACINRMAVISSRGETGRDWRAILIFA
jgi:hypothetical protein